MKSQDEADALDAVALIGMVGRFPEAPDLERLWKNLSTGVESIRTFTDEELREAGLEPGRIADPNFVRAGTVLEGIDLFDAPFFGLSPREAELMDPQQRLLLEAAAEALDCAGYDSQAYSGRIGVYMSGRISDYFLSNLSSNPDLVARMNPLQILFGNDKDYLATFIAYKLNLRGPGISVQTACSSSLVAVHLACESVLNEQCDMALAGGVAVNLPQKAGYLYQPGGVLSPDGHCRAFDAAAAGTVFGSGLGVVVLKRLDRALADGDSILAVIRGSATNNDGALKAGYSAPSENGQAAVITEALEVAGVHPDTIDYVEAHGTGTQLGDPIEVAALTQAFRHWTARRGYCALGSIKTNFGHLEPAAGIAGLIKAVLMLRHGTLVPSLHFERPNPNIDFGESPFHVVARAMEWPRNGRPRRAAVSSFGMGGTNAHVVLEEAPATGPSGPSRPWQLVTLSARTPTALEKATENLAGHLEAHPDLALADAAYTLHVGRKAFAHRRMVVCRDAADARQALTALEPRRVLTAHDETDGRPVTFLFPGQGAQYVGMGEDLYASEPVFREQVDRCAELLNPHLACDLREMLYPRGERGEAAKLRLDATGAAQPALFVIEYALAKLLGSWGIAPQAMIGHSIGEYVAACLAGVFSLESALALVSARGKLMESLPPGAMLAVSLPPSQLDALLGPGLDLAAVNGPALGTIAGTEPAIEALAAELARRGVEHRRLHTSHAFHSAMMEPILDAFGERVRGCALKAPTIPYLSNLTGTWITAAEATSPAYWTRHLRNAVLFASGVGELLADGRRALLEVGPGRTLSTFARQCARSVGPPIGATTMRRPQDQEPDSAVLLTALGRLWLAGVPIDWPSFHAGERRHRVPLPTYPFERQRYWIEPRRAAARRSVDAALVPEVLPAEAETTALALHDRPALLGTYAPPRTEIEAGVVRIWQDLLGIEQIGLYDNFFELGGHSLLLVQVVSSIRDAFRVELPMRGVAEAATVAELAAVIEVQRVEQAEVGAFSSAPALMADPEGRYEPFPLTEVQEAYWIGRTGALQLGNVATHQYFEVENEGLDVDRLAHAWRKLIHRHDMLRAVILPDGRQQVLAEVPPYEIEMVDLRGLEPRTAAARLESLRERMSHQVLPSDRWPLFELVASRVDDRRVRLHISLDLLIADAWSVEILKRELTQAYANPEAPWPQLDFCFRDYVLSEVAFRESEAYRRSLEYWRSRLPNLPPPPELPLVRNPADLDRPRFVRRSGGLDAEAWSRLKARGARAGLTPSGILLAAYSEVLGRWSKSARFLLNVTVFNRLPVHPLVNDVVGDFTSLSLLEVDGLTPESFEKRARRLQTRIWEDLDHRAVSGIRVLRERIRQDRGIFGALAPVVFTSVLNLRTLDEPPPDATAAGLLEQDDYSISQTPQVWLDHVATERYGNLLYTWDAVADLFPPGLLTAMFAAYHTLLARLADGEEAWQEREPNLLPAAQLTLRESVNATSAPVPQGLLHQPFLHWAQAHPERPAVLAPARTLSYGELHRLSLRIAHRLRELCVRPNSLVAVVMEKGWEQVAAVLGILGSGAAYLPIDPSLPKERLEYLLAQGEVELALTQVALVGRLEWPAAVRPLAVDGGDFDDASEEPLAPVQDPGDLAYVIFTSGTTGLPKGVMIDHRGALNTIVDLNERFAVGPEDRVLSLSALSFDLSVYDIFGLLAAGGAVVLPAPDQLREPGHWIDRLAEGVTLWNTVPALMKMLTDYAKSRPEMLPQSLRRVLMSGDWIPVTLPDEIRSLFPGAEVVSLGGATEASIWSILYPIGQIDPIWTSIPYGRPMVNQRFHVLNEALEPCPDWVPGQLFIGGIGLAQGYWRDAERTAASFFSHPRTGERLYRTGDLGRWLPDGTIEFLGREDLQVKVQGYRIELGEIEACLTQHPAVRDGVVAALGEARGEKRLVAYVVPERDEPAGPTPAEMTSAAPGDSAATPVLQDPIERLEFKTQQLGIRQVAELPTLQLDGGPADAAFLRPFAERRTHRRYLQQPLPVADFGHLLHCLGQIQLEGKPKYRYPSAGSLYPVQTYVYVKADRVEGLPAGAYYYHPLEHRLVALSGGRLETATFGSENGPTYEKAAFAIFLIAQMKAIAPLYGSLARDFSLLEAGTMSQLLMTVAPERQLGLCPVGTLFFDRVRALFSLEESHEFLHALVGGQVPQGQEPEASADDYELFLKLLAQESPQGAAASAVEVLPALPEVRAWQDDGSLVEELRTFLSAKLPSYMVPAAFVLLEALPLSANGKVDRRALPRPDLAASAEREYLAPRDAMEETVAALWGEVLGLERVGVYDNFFEAGGHSLLAARLIGRLREAFQVDLPLASLFEVPTVDGLAAAIRRLGPVSPLRGETLPTLVPDPERRYEPFPLTDLQQAYWIGRTGAFELGNVSPQYFLELAVDDLDVGRFTAALRQLIARHDMLRAEMLPDGRQRILPEVPPYEPALLDLRAVAPAAREAALLDLRRHLAENGPPIDRPPLLAVALCRVDERRYHLFFSLSLLVCDAWSFRIFSRELGAFYGRPDVPLPAVDLSFRDYVLAIVALEETEAFHRSLAYWQQRLATLPPPPELPLARNPASLATAVLARRTAILEPERWARFKEHAASAGVTVDAALGAAYAEVLATWSKSQRFTLNVLYFNRLDLHPQVRSIFANFSSTILLEVDASRQESFAARARRFQEQLWRDLEHGAVTGVRVLRELNRLQGRGSRVTMPVVFASTAGLNREETPDAGRQGSVGEVVTSRLQTPQVWLDHQVYDLEGTLSFNWDAVEELFPPGLVESMFQTYRALLERLAAPTAEAWTEGARRLLPQPQMTARALANATAAPLSERLLHELFAERVAADPDRPAVIAANRTLTYAELDRAAGSVARRLRKLGVRPNTLVAVVMERGWEQVAAVLGILRAGAAYLPVSPDLPAERLALLLERGEARIALTQPRFDLRLEWPAGVKRLRVDAGSLRGASAPATVSIQTPEDLAYVIFTSGSTGQPKGVMIDHRGAVNTVLDINRRLQIGPDDRVLALSSLSFDLSVYDLFGILAAGGAVVLPEPEANREPARWLAWMERTGVTVWDTVPALMVMLADHAEARGEPLPATLRRVLLSGDWIPVTLPDRIRTLCPGAEVISLGGATEASIWSICYPIAAVDPSWTSIPYGRPLANQRFHVLNEALEPCPDWVPGELYIAGGGLAQGYWRDEAITRAAFFTHPVTGERLYRTGDLGRYLPEGEIEFLGREDFQVKIQGFRIELEEIEAALLRHPAVRAAAVVAVGERRGSKRLAAFAVPAPQVQPAVEELRGFLREKLPDYMVPHSLALLEELPLTANGKVDRGALQAAASGRGERSAQFVAPRDEVERRLAALWEEILETSPVGAADDFFDLGGHSLLAVRLMARIQREFDRDLPLSALFGGATVEHLAGLLRSEGAGGEGFSALVPIQRNGAGRPLFLVHPVGGSVLCYGELGRLLNDGPPCYALQVPATAELLSTVEEIAARYLAEVRAVQPEGPYRLGGWSMGGVVAFEMARQLAREGVGVDLLAVLDATAPTGDPEEIDDAGLLAWFARDLGALAGVALEIAAGELRGLPPKERLRLLLDRARGAGALPPELGVRELQRHVDVFRANSQALLRYHPDPYAGSLLLLAASEGELGGEDPAARWSSLARGGVELHRVPGTHYTVVRRPGVEVVADRLRKHLGLRPLRTA
ncbi:MAG TPA: amino acid adenylation domain-containing protein [Thermoanaerobaculia bacterium]|jgi:amino acid adenylation domain-containing protein|nr:amino acid adenylation domain-containing protein [Thermoanaerobaculia bacterium]